MKRRAYFRRQRGQSYVEYLVVAFAFVAIWQIIDLVMVLLAEHHSEYTWSITQPFF